MSGVRLVACSIAVAGAWAGCGGSTHELPPAPEPAKSPPLRERPEGRVVKVGNKPEGLAFDTKTGLLAVGLAQPNRLALVAGDSGRVVRRVGLPASPRHLQLVAPGGPVLVPVEAANELVDATLPRGQITTARVGKQPHDAAYADGRTFVADELANTVTVLEGARTIKTLRAPTQPGGVEVTGDGRLLGVIGVRARQLELFDTRTLRSVGRVNVGVGPTHLVALGRRFFVVDTRGNGVIEVRTDPKPLVHRRIPLAGRPYGIALDRVRQRLWVTLTERNQVVELSTKGRLATLPAVRQPNSVAVDELSGKAFVAGKVDGTIQTVEPR